MIYPAPKPIKAVKRLRRYLRKFRTGDRAALEHSATEAWNLAVLARDGYRCRAILPSGSRCNAPGRDPHHIIRRGFKATKWLLRNGLTLCVHHHREDLIGLPALTKRTAGEAEYALLGAISRSGSVPDDERLKEIIKELSGHALVCPKFCDKQEAV